MERSVSADACVPQLEASLMAPKESAALGDRFELVFSLTNPGATDVWVLKWYTPLEGMKGDILEVRRDGQPVRYEGPMFKRGNPSANDYARVPAKESVTIAVDPGLGYSIDKPGLYEFRFRGEFYDASDFKPPRASWSERFTSPLIGVLRTSRLISRLVPW